MDNVANQVKRHKNLIQSAGGTVASIGLEQTGKKIAGSLITPATWAVNYMADKSQPSLTDVGIYASGFVSAPASIVTGLFKAAVDDDINKKLELIRRKEPSECAPYIKPCYYYSYYAPQINATKIAYSGGTAWISSYGLWVYITDASDALIADYIPQDFNTLYQPKKPYQVGKSGGFVWGAVRKR